MKKASAFRRGSIQGLNTDNAKQFIENIYEHNNFTLEETKKTRKFALKKNQLKDFISSSERFDLGKVEQDEPPKEIKETPKQQIDIPNVIVKRIPNLKIKEISVSNTRYFRNDGINRLDRVTKNLMNDFDELDESLSLLQVNLQHIEAITTDCERYANVNNTLSSSGLRQLNQIHYINSNSNIFNVVFHKILEFIV